jgi:hypothetical protein
MSRISSRLQAGVLLDDISWMVDGDVKDACSTVTYLRNTSGVKGKGGGQVLERDTSDKPSDKTSDKTSDTMSVPEGDEGDESDEGDEGEDGRVGSG